MAENEIVEKHENIKIGDSVCRLKGTYRPPVNVIYGGLQEGVVIKIVKNDKNSVWLHVARDGDRGFVQLMPYEQVVKIDKDFPKSVHGHLKMF